MPTYSFEIDPRPAELGGGYRLRLLIDGQEEGGGVFPANPDADPEGRMAHADALQEGEDWLASIDRRAPEYRPRPAEDGGAYRLMPDDRLLYPHASQGEPSPVVLDWTPDELTHDFLNPPAEVIQAAAELGSMAGAVGYDEAGRLVRVRPDGSLEAVPDDEQAGPQ